MFKVMFFRLHAITLARNRLLHWLTNSFFRNRFLHWLTNSLVDDVLWCACPWHEALRAGLIIVPFMPWHIGPPVVTPRGHMLILFYHITFYNYGSIRVWRRIGLFYQNCTRFKKQRAFFYKRGPLIQGHKIVCPRLEHLLNFTLRYGYSLW